MQKIGGMSGVLGLLPGVGKIKNQLAEANLDDRVIKRQHAIIMSMTPHERRNPKVLDARRKRRVAAGSGTRVEDINRLLKMHRQMADLMKMVGKGKGMLGRMFGTGGGAAPSPAEVERMQAELARLDPKALESLPKELREALPQGAPAPGTPGLPGLAGRPMPKLPGLPGFGGAPRFPFPGGPGKKK
jgi:signal recognition particle subunit SRP54